MMIEPEKLKAFLDQLVKDPSLSMKPDGTTFCNVGLARAAALFGYHGFTRADGEPMTAREIIAKIETSPMEWLVCSSKQASDFAQRGGWAVSFMKVLKLDAAGKLTPERAAHDHVATIYPAPMGNSGSLHRDVVFVANIGKDNKVMLSSKAYPVVQGEASSAILVGGFS